MIPVLIFLLVSAMVGGGASVAAQNSLPGDLLYPIKVGLNEKVGAALASSAEAKADFDSKIALRRVMEAEQLSINGNVSADVEAQLESNFRAHAERVTARVAELQSAGRLDAALEANSNFQSSLNAHRAILVRLADEDKDASDKTGLLGLSVRVGNTVSASGVVAADIESRLKLSSSVDIQAAAEGKLGAAQNKVAEVRKFLDSNEISVSADVKARAEARLTEANGAIAQAKIKIENKAYGEAFVLSQRAQRLAQESQNIIRGNGEIDLRLKLNSLEIKANSDANVESSGSSSRESSTGKATGKTSATVQVGGSAGAESNDSGANADGSVKVNVGL